MIAYARFFIDWKIGYGISALVTFDEDLLPSLSFPLSNINETSYHEPSPHLHLMVAKLAMSPSRTTLTTSSSSLFNVRSPF